jgi:hypothetical protein
MIDRGRIQSTIIHIEDVGIMPHNSAVEMIDSYYNIHQKETAAFKKFKGLQYSSFFTI